MTEREREADSGGAETPGPDLIRGFLSERFGAVDDLRALQPGGWSSAYSFRARDRELVLRLGPHREDFEKERVAATWHAPGVPVPEILGLGEAFDGFWIVSQRHHGTKLADLDPSRVRQVIPSLFGVLVAMRRITLPGEGFGIWLAPGCDAPASSWAEFLCGVAQRDESRLVDWRRKLAAHPEANAAFQRGTEALHAAVGDLPGTRGLVHADLLLNHLVDDNNAIVTVFDWGNAIAGDPLYDIAWILYCIPWFPSIDRRQVLDLAHHHFPDGNLERVLDLYEIHIGVSSLQYLAFMNDLAALGSSADRITRMLSTFDA